MPWATLIWWKSGRIFRLFTIKKPLKRTRITYGYSGLGDAYAQLKERDKALSSYHKALELRPDYALVYYKLGLFYEDNNPAEAIKNFQKYLQSGRTIEYRDEVAAKIEALKLSSKP